MMRKLMKKAVILLCFYSLLASADAFDQTTKKTEPHGLPPEDIKSFVQTPKRGGTLIYGRSTDSSGLDPAYEVDGNSFMVCENVFETLIGFKDESTLFDPILAPFGVISSDGLTYTFNLRKGVNFHDGTRFNADSVVFSLGRMMKERTVKFFGKGWDFPKQEHPSEYWVSMEMDDTLDAIEAKDEYTVVFRLKRVDAPFLFNLAMNFAAIISPTAFLKDPKGFARNPVGTGPFKFSKWVEGDRIALEAFKDYWDKGQGPYLDRLVFRVIPESSVQLSEVKAGKIHMCDSPDPADIERTKKDPKLQVFSQFGMNISYLGFNHKKEPWKSNVKLRQAIAHAINRKAIVDQVYQGRGEVVKNCMPPTVWGYNYDVPGYAYDVELSKKLLAEAGYPEGKGLPEITLWAIPVPRPYNPDGLKVGGAMIGDLAKIGISSRMVSYDWGTYLRRQREQPQDMDLFQLGWTGDNGDPDNFLAVLFDGLASPSVRTQWYNEAYHRLMEEGKQNTGQAKRTEIYRKAQQLMYEECPVIPIAHSIVMTPSSKKVINFKPHPTGAIRMKSVWLQ